MEGSEKNHYRDPLIAMTFFAILFFIILVAIVVIWCKKRRQTEVKTVVIEPKKRPISTKVVTQSNGGGQHAANGNVDIEAGPITTDEIELSDDQEETKKIPAEEKTDDKAELVKSEDSNEPTPQPDAAKATPVEPDVITTTSEAEVNPSQQTEPPATKSEDEKGEINPSFQKDDEDETQGS